MLAGAHATPPAPQGERLPGPARAKNPNGAASLKAAWDQLAAWKTVIDARMATTPAIPKVRMRCSLCCTTPAAALAPALRSLLTPPLRALTAAPTPAPRRTLTAAARRSAWPT